MKFQTPYIEDSNGTAIYPDAKEFFGRTHREGDLLVGHYFGSLSLTPYVEPPQAYREEITREELVEMFPSLKQRAEVLERIAQTPTHQATFDAMEYGAFDVTLPRVVNLLDDLKVLNGGPLPNPKIEDVKRGVPL